MRTRKIDLAKVGVIMLVAVALWMHSFTALAVAVLLTVVDLTLTVRR